MEVARALGREVNQRRNRLQWLWLSVGGLTAGVQVDAELFMISGKSSAPGAIAPHH